jgi:hypothetical protein
MIWDVDKKGTDLNHRFRRYRQYHEIDDPVTYRGQKLRGG